MIIQFGRIAWRDTLPSWGFLHSRPQFLRVWGRDWFSWCIYLFFVVCKVKIRATWMLKRGQNRKRCVFFSTSIQLPLGCNSYFANQRGWTAVVWLFLTNGKKKHQKTASYEGFRAPSSHVGSLRLVFIMRARETQSIIWYYQKLRLVWPEVF